MAPMFKLWRGARGQGSKSLSVRPAGSAHVQEAQGREGVGFCQRSIHFLDLPGEPNSIPDVMMFLTRCSWLEVRSWGTPGNAC